MTTSIRNAAVITGVIVVVVGIAILRTRPQREETAISQPVPQKLPRLVDLGADKCIPCKKLAPILEELRREYANRVQVEFIDVWKNPPAAETYNISLIPTQILYDSEGTEVWRHEGFVSKEDLVARFAEVGVR